MTSRFVCFSESREPRADRLRAGAGDERLRRPQQHHAPHHGGINLLPGEAG